MNSRRYLKKHGKKYSKKHGKKHSKNVSKNNSEKTSDNYQKKCDEIKQLLISTYPDTIFEFIENEDTSLVEVIINSKGKITILPCNTWKEVQRHVNKKINYDHDHPGDCDICCNKISKNVSCNKCSNNWCINCYINLFRSGKGVIICPCCRFSIGNRFPNHMIEHGVAEIKMKAGLL